MRTMLAIAIAAAAAILGGCAIVVAPGGDGDYHVSTPFSGVQGDGVITREQRPVGTVQALEAGGSMVVEVRVGPAPSLVVEADRNLLPLIRTDVRGDSLVISTEGSYRSSNPVHVIYTTPRLTEVRHGGSGKLTVQDLNGAPLQVHQSGSGTLVLAGRVDKLDIDGSGSGRVDADALQAGSARLALSGSGRMSIGQVRGDYADVGVSGSGELRVSGAVRSLSAHSSGSGRLELAGLSSRQADLSSSGSGGISANVSDSLVAQTTGSGGIRVAGNPAQRNVSGKNVQLLN
ncbi:head GIN domain-containing protein [Massilia sp. 9096]|uniref:head GIN domain-containing protein n=1 Tax=Massilia sp. 9096 TaxID=1500894 RepID=UPI000561D24E|nr:head GIN domain-containing protein [Massilia sp. 9096]